MAEKFSRKRLKDLIDQEFEGKVQQFALTLETSRQRVENILSGTSKPQIRFFEQISAVHGIPVQYFFVENEVCVMQDKAK